MTLRLRRPQPEDESQALALHESGEREDFDVLLGSGTYLERIVQWERESRGEDLPPGRVAADFLFAEVGEDIVGRVSIRHDLNPFLLDVGGHIGYFVAPQFRRQGYATEILRQSLEWLRNLDVERALVTCDDDNLGSIGTIEANGGQLEDVRDQGSGHPAKRRYWIDL